MKKAMTRYRLFSDGSIRRKDSPPHPVRTVVDNDFHVPAVEHPPVDLDHTRKHRDEAKS